jgi:hypothetical protein
MQRPKNINPMYTRCFIRHFAPNFTVVITYPVSNYYNETVIKWSKNLEIKKAGK